MRRLSASAKLPTTPEPSALGRRLAAHIAADGPIGLDIFMEAALGDPEHGYYRTRDPLGRAGDFVTAPEISQIFGEIVGLWCAEMWQRLGSPARFGLVELGPGRGTLMSDVLRTLAILPECRRAADIHLVETSPVLRQIQAATLAERHADKPAVWHESISDLPPGPLLILANEFFDALPIRQFIKRGDGWQERRVGLNDAGDFIFVEVDSAPPPKAPETSSGGTLFETAEPAWALALELGERLGRHGGAALIIDYGNDGTQSGDTLQALRAQRPAPPLEAPGEADITAHVDFGALARAFSSRGVVAHGPVAQRDFLLANGAAQRAERLMRDADPARRAGIAHDLTRLTGIGQMGVLFKALAITPPGLDTPPGFPGKPSAP